jgi:beta-N-acetylhexosaminidase
MSPSTKRINAIFGFAGQALTAEEISFFKACKPLGFILFARNISDPQQVKQLTDSLRTLNGDDSLILIDQEGGRVRRLRPPHFRDAKAAGIFAEIAKSDLNKAVEEVQKEYFAIGTELKSLGINVDCAPVADLLQHDAHEIIGDRSFGDKPDIVTALCRAAIHGLNTAGVKEVIKHIPGHGRAKADSHHALPIITEKLSVLEQTDFKVFENLCDAEFAMTAHILYTALDDKEPVTFSKNAINYIRKNLGYKGKIMSDDLSMHALSGTFAERTQKSFAAGCDIVLHCNGEMDEMREIARNCAL